MSDTITNSDATADVRAAASTAPVLYRVLAADRPHANPLRIELGDADELHIGRQRERSGAPDKERERDEVEQKDGVQVVHIDDPAMSSRHARIRCRGAAFTLLDDGSKNGCRVDGAPVREAWLRDGSWIELGNNHFLFRVAAAVYREGSAATDPVEPAWVTSVPQLAEQLGQLRRIAASRQPVLLRGPTGSGKEVVARALHRQSQRSGPFVAVNCAALPDALLEGELFGYRRGAFTGAHVRHEGIVAAAQRGTLFLDEVADLSLGGQAKLLRVLQEHAVQALGSATSKRLDLRIVTATHRDLEGMIAAGTLREDLFARINGFQLTLPPLRERREDLGHLVSHLLSKHGAREGTRFSRTAARCLLHYDWPRNIRELEQVLASALALAEEGVIRRSHLPDALLTTLDANSRQAPLPPLSASDQALRSQLSALLWQHQGNLSEVARQLGKKRQQIQKWCRRLQLDSASYRSG